MSALCMWPQWPNLELAEVNLPSLRLLRLFSSKGQDHPQPELQGLSYLICHNSESALGQAHIKGYLMTFSGLSW